MKVAAVVGVLAVLLVCQGAFAQDGYVSSSACCPSVSYSTCFPTVSTTCCPSVSYSTYYPSASYATYYPSVSYRAVAYEKRSICSLCRPRTRVVYTPVYSTPVYTSACCW